MKVPSPLGIKEQGSAHHFTFFSKSAAHIRLNLFHANEATPFRKETMKSDNEGLWRCVCEELPSCFEYTYTLSSSLLSPGHSQQNKSVEVLDPSAHLINSPSQFLTKANYPLRSMYTTPIPFDWELDAKPLHPLQNIIIYEAHIRGFSQNLSSKTPSSFLSLIDKIPHLQQLGITTLELLPIFEFDETQHPAGKRAEENHLCNFWGYSTRSFFALMHRYGSSQEKALAEFKEMVKALHKAGIELILDIVFNHTDEGNSKRGFHSFSAIDKESYFVTINGEHTNYSGCGNTFSCNSPAGMNLIIGALRYWVKECHVDGFRFDLGSILYRGDKGDILEKPPIIDLIINDPILSSSKLFVEPWDAAGLYQLGSFSNYRFSEWNDKFRDDVRDFLRGTGSKTNFVHRLLGSPDIWKEFSPVKSVNYVAIHDGFSLFDVCSFSQKNNAINGESNRDGSNENKSWNCGEEGLEVGSKVAKLRLRQMRNFYLTLFCSKGVPLFLMGDEYGHTKKGNNNTYCHDTKINYFLWDQLEKNKELFEFVSSLIHFRKSTPYFTNDHFLNETQVIDLFQDDPSRLFLVLDQTVVLLFNPTDKPTCFILPRKALVVADTYDPEKSFSDVYLAKDVEHNLEPFSSILLILEKS